jgi:signal transduction histidine kinase
MKDSLETEQLDLLLDPEALLRHILTLAVDKAEADSGSLMLLNPNTKALDIEVSIGLGKYARGTKLKLGEGITGWVASVGRPMRVDDVTHDRRYVAVDANTRSELAIPLLLNDQVIGVINVDSVKRAAFTDKHERALIELAETTVEWIRLAWDIDQLRAKGSQLETLVDMGQLIVSEDDLNNVLDRIAEESTRLMNVAISSIMLLSEDGTELELRAWHGASSEYIKRPNLQVSDSLVGVVVKRQKPTTVLNVQSQAQYQQTELARKEGLVSLLSVPLVFEGRSLGVLSVYTKKLHRFSNEEIRLLTAMAGLSAVAIAKAQLLKRVLRAEESLREAERLSALGWLAAEIAHEIRNPLAVIQMLFHSMVEDLELKGETRRDANLIEEKMKDLNRILDQVLTFSRSAEPEFSRLDAHRMMEDLALLLRVKVDEEQIQLKRKLEGNSLSFSGDRTQVEQAILNLVVNACQAMKSGGELTLSARPLREGDQDYIEIGVRDTGPGMTPEEVDVIFDPFMTSKPGGTGIGLAMVKKIVDAHGGKLVVESTPGRGTEVIMRFPGSAEPSLNE